MRKSGRENPRREDFLIAMYGEMWQNINRHIIVVWQSVSVLAGALAVLALVEKKVISLDIAVSLIVVISAWLIAHVFDASGWFNRNLVIISNIERQFLGPSDLHDIHHFFKGHREDRKPIEHLQVHFWFGIGICGIALLHHFLIRVLPGIGNPISHFDPPRALPYATSVIAFLLLRKLWKKQRQEYENLIRESPGITLEESSM